MVQETNVSMTKEEAQEVLESVKRILRVYAGMFQDVLTLIQASADMGLDSVDSKLLIQILQRHDEAIRKL